MVKKLIIFAFVFAFSLNLLVLADENNSKYQDENVKNVVTEYYSPDLYDDIVNTSANVRNNIEINAKSAVLMEKSTGKIIFKKNENERVSPASITKIMTMLLVIEAIESKKISFYDKVTASEHAASMGGSQIWLKVGERMSVHDLLKSVAVGSANDASVALAEKVAGSEEAFVAKMNQKAKELGMKNTNFTNACGLDDDNLYTSAKDVAIMSKALISHELIKQYTTIWLDTVRNETVQLVNTNKLVRFYKGATGLKTGTTNRAGCCLSATAKRGGMELIAVIMGAENSKERFSQAKKLLDFGFANLFIYKPSKSVKIKNNLRLAKGQKNSVKIKCNKIENELLDLNRKGNIRVNVSYKNNLQAPIIKGEVLGNVAVEDGNKPFRTYDIYADETVEKANFKFNLLRLLKGTIIL